MKRLAILFSAVFIYLASSQLHAAGNQYEETYNVGVVSGNIDGGFNFGEVAVSGFSLTARNKKSVLEYVNMSSDAGNLGATSDTWETELQGIYLSLLGEGQPYMKFKVGSMKQEMVRTESGIVSSELTTITSYGLGFGFKLGSRILLEFEVMSLDNDMTLMTGTLLF
ncbi:MAG: hypothetical protein OEY11_13035 [Gammaproteobacteria bacterium]|nr:hypothetical protein [Gammaproteobacteria bacterium]